MSGDDPITGPPAGHGSDTGAQHIPSAVRLAGAQRAAGAVGQAGTEHDAAALTDGRRDQAGQPGEVGGQPGQPGQADGHAGRVDNGVRGPHDADPDGMVGVLLSGRYRLEQRIAAGGMGEVWRGSDEVLGRPVAVKLLRHAYIGDESLASRFRAEARYAASLSHPGIAQVFDYGEQDTRPGGDSGRGGAYLVMELVPGEPLSAILARSGQLSPEVTLDIIGQAACALQAAHASGIVHRDIKPGNLLVTADGRVKITDFGIARAVQAAHAGHLTQTGMVMGTAQYVSPEQASGLRVTHASDVYSLGVVAYECLAGAPPFAADALIALALAHVREVPPPLPPSVPPLVCDMVMRMLAKRPEDRPASAQAVADRASVLRDVLPSTAGPGLAEMASEDAPTWFSEDAPTSHRLHDGATAQIPINDPERLPRAPRRPIRRRALVVAALSVTILALGGVTTALMLNGHHAADAGGSAGGATASASPHVTRHPHHAGNPTSPTQPATFPVSPAPQPPTPTVSATPSPTVSATPTPTRTSSAAPSPTVSATPTRTSSAAPTPTRTASAPPTAATVPASTP
jgi:serine/threonine protein kinase